MTTILWLKAFHVAFMVAWFSGIFYLPRLFVNHAETNSKDVSEHLKGMEKRLINFITPFALLTIGFGASLIYQYGMDWFIASKWIHIKLALVVLMIIYHLYCFKIVKTFHNDENTRSGRFYRLFNELPVFALFGIIILAYVKPF
jgi:putative membrane protein